MRNGMLVATLVVGAALGSIACGRGSDRKGTTGASAGASASAAIVDPSAKKATTPNTSVRFDLCEIARGVAPAPHRRRLEAGHVGRGREQRARRGAGPGPAGWR